MGLFGRNPEQVSRGGKVVYVLYCNRGKCKKNGFEGDTEKACKKEFNSHQRAHDTIARNGAKSIEKLQEKRSKKGKCTKCGKDPCKMTTQACINQAIGEWGSSMDIDVSDPATFSEQLNFYKNKM